MAWELVHLTSSPCPLKTTDRGEIAQLNGFFILSRQVRSACWALEKGISVVICNGMAENAVRNIIAGRKLGTFFTDTKNGGVSVESAAEQGKI